MLDLYEINELERLWNEHHKKRKQMLKVAFIAICVVLAICALVLVIYFSFSAGRKELQDANDASNKLAQAKIEQARINSLKQKIILANKDKPHQNITTKPTEAVRAKSAPSAISPTEASVNKSEAKVASAKSAPEASVNKSEVALVSSEVSNTSELLAAIRQAQGDLKTLLKPDESANLHTEIHSALVASVNMPKFATKIPKKPDHSKVQIVQANMQEINVHAKKSVKINDELEYLKRRFDEHKSPYFALDIANVYYAKKDFANAQKWALVANNIDDENENSWLLFARAKAASGSKSEAIKILNTYLDKNPTSTAANALMDELKGNK